MPCRKIIKPFVSKTFLILNNCEGMIWQIMWKKQRPHILCTSPFQIGWWESLLVLLAIQHSYTQTTQRLALVPPILERLQEEFPASAAYHQVESEAAVLNELELDVIHILIFKLYPTEKIKQFQAGCIKIILANRPGCTLVK